MTRHPLIIEAGLAVGAAMLQWGYVRISWQSVVDQEAANLLRAMGWADPDPDVLSTSQEIVEGYRTPLAQVPGNVATLQFNTRVSP